LKKGVPVQTFFGWTPRAQEEQEGRIVAPSGLRTFWWEGLTKSTRPDTHSFVIVGMDRSNDKAWVNLPIGGWFGVQKYKSVDLSWLRKRMESLRPELKYVTIAYVQSDEHAPDDAAIRQLVKKRIQGKILGEPGAYAENPPDRFMYGLKALRTLRDDLEPSRVIRILEARSARQGITPLEILVWMKLALYQHVFTTSLAAEYLEAERMIGEWEWLSKLNMLYRRLYVSNVKLVDIVRTTTDKRGWGQGFEPVLKEMRGTIDEIVRHMEKYAKQAATSK
jgi:hypothetical protein